MSDAQSIESVGSYSPHETVSISAVGGGAGLCWKLHETGRPILASEMHTEASKDQADRMPAN